MARDEVRGPCATHSWTSTLTCSQVFAGPMSESVPSSTTGFANRQSRAGSIASFSYFHEEDELPECLSDEAILDDIEDESDHGTNAEADLESASISPPRRKSSTFSRVSAEHPLLHRHDSIKTEMSGHHRSDRTSQKIYIESEDLVIVIAGFGTSRLGYGAYITLCILTLGLCYLFLRWLPRLRVLLVGSPRALRDCAWVVVEVRLILSWIFSVKKH